MTSRHLRQHDWRLCWRKQNPSFSLKKLQPWRRKARKCTLLKYFPSFPIFGSFSNQQNIYLLVSPSPTIALNFRIRTQRERSWNYANEYLFPLSLLQPLLRIEVTGWKKKDSVIREPLNDFGVIRIIKIRTKLRWSLIFCASESNRNRKYKDG